MALTFGTLGQWKNVQINRNVRTDSSYPLIFFGPCTKLQAHFSVVSIVRKATLRGHPSLCLFMCNFYWKLKADVSGNSGALKQNYMSPEGNKLQNSLRMLNILWANVLPLTFNLKYFMCKSVKDIPQPEGQGKPRNRG